MEGNGAALRYAKAVLSLAQDKNVAKEVNQDMLLIANTIAESNELRVILKSPVVKTSIKRNCLDQIFTGVNGVTSGLFDVLLDNNRINLLSLVASKYNRLFDELNDVQVAKITTAVPLSSELEKEVQAKVRELTGSEAKINNFIDEGIIGGFILRVGDLQYNASIAGQLKDLKREFLNDTYISKI